MTTKTNQTEKNFKVKIFYIQTPKDYNLINKETNDYLLITKMEEFYVIVDNLEHYELVHEEEIFADMVHIEALYQRFQENGEIRSMMIGDLIQIDEKVYVVSGEGFTEIRNPFNLITKTQLLNSYAVLKKWNDELIEKHKNDYISYSAFIRNPSYKIYAKKTQATISFQSKNFCSIMIKRITEGLPEHLEVFIYNVYQGKDCLSVEITISLKHLII